MHSDLHTQLPPLHHRTLSISPWWVRKEEEGGRRGLASARMPQDVISPGPPVYKSCITATWCQTFPPWKECLFNRFHVNGLQRENPQPDSLLVQGTAF